MDRGNDTPVDEEAPVASVETLKSRIRGDLERRILSGELGPGDRIPFEHELVEHYGCSRMTVNKAIASLVEAGLIERRRRAGSFVRRPAALSAVLKIQDIRAEIEASRRRYAYRLDHRKARKATIADAEALGVARGDPVLALVCTHFADGRPFAHEDRLLNLAAVPQVAGIDFTTVTPGAWLIAHVPWTRAEHRISARAADPRLAQALDIVPGAACLVMRRRTFRSGQTITAVRLTYPGDQHELVAEFTP
jgi:GntR family histidine utilization transcriptional repressor